MMNPVLISNGSGNGAGVDHVARDAAAAAQTLAQSASDGLGGKATTASVTAVEDRVTVLETRLVGTITKTVRKNGSGDFTTISQALNWFRSQDRRSGARAIIDVGPSATPYVEDLDPAPLFTEEGYLTIRGSYEPDRVATGAYTVGQLINTTDGWVVTVPLSTADLAGLQIGDAVFCHFGLPAGGSDAQNRMVTSAMVSAKTGAAAVLIVRGTSPTALPGLRIVRPAVQIVISKTLEFSGGGRTWSPDRICIRSNSAPEVRATFNGVIMQSGTKLTTVDPMGAVGITVPSLILANFATAMVMAPESEFRGSISISGHRFNGVYCLGRFMPRAFVSSGNGADSVDIVGVVGSLVMTAEGIDMKSLVLGNVGAGFATLSLARMVVTNLLCKGHSFADFYTADAALVRTVGLSGSVYAPGANSYGNNNAYNLVA